MQGHEHEHEHERVALGGPGRRGRRPFGPRRPSRPGPLVAAVLASALVAPVSCGSGGGDSGRPAAAGASHEPERPALDESSAIGKAVVALRPALDGASWRRPLEEVLAGFRGPDREAMTALLRETYEERGHRPVFLDGLWPGEAAAAMVAAVREVPSHGLPASRYRPGVLLPLHGSLALDPAGGPRTLTGTEADLERLARLEHQMPRSIYKAPRENEKVPEVSYRPLDKLPELPPVSAELRCLLPELVEAARAGAGLAEGELASRCGLAPAALAGRLEEVGRQVAAREAERPRLALLDALLLQAFYQWVLDFSIDLRVHPFKSLGPANRARLPRERGAELRAALGDLDDGEAFASRLRAFLPRSREYALAREALARYVGLTDRPAPPELRAPGRWLEKGARGEAVVALQRRLAAEGYYGGPASGELDEATHAAVVRYQRARGLADGGVVGSETVESLNVPFDWRVRQLLVALGRHRESPRSRRPPDGLHLRVNLPAFELELVEGDRTVRRHKVIVGSNRLVADPLNGGVVWHMRRTPIFETKVTEVVLNPTWIVPEAIRLEEIEPKLRASPTYLAENNFAKVGALLVQGPAPSNPLGVVKFSLESTDAIYLHDTDKRWLFAETRRDLSHGCVRVDGAVELAKHLLGLQGVEPARIDKRIAEATTSPIKLESPVPVFVEYLTVGFAEDGEPIFWDDLYQYDLAYWKKRTPITRRFP